MKKIFNRFKNIKYTFTQRLALVLLLAIFLPFTYIIYTYSAGMMRSAKDEIVTSYLQKNQVSADNLMNFFVETGGKFEFFNKYGVLSDTLKTSNPQRIMNRIENAGVLNEMFSIVFNNNRQMKLIIYHNNPNIYNPSYFKSIEKLKQTDYYDKISSLDNNETYCRLGESDDGYRFYIYRRYNTFENIQAYFEVSIPYTALRKLMNVSESEKSKVYVTLPDNSTYLFGDIEPLKTDIAKNRKTYFLEKTVCNIKITTAFLKSEYQKKQRVILYTDVIVIILLGTLILFVVKMIVFFLTRRLNQIVSMIMSQDEKSTKLEKVYNDEFDIISNKLIEYSETMKRRNQEDLVKQKKLMQMEFMLLQERISPHFLYNTLSSIKWAYNNPQLCKLIDSMVKYYRIALNLGNNYITLNDELTGVGEYLKIQKFAYEKEFKFNIFCDETIRNVKILKNLIQPVVENAFMHGINCYDADDGFINVSAVCEGDGIIITVENNGIVITDEAINKIFDNKEVVEVITRGSGYAIKNIIRRIKLCYGEKYGLKITNNGKTIVSIIIPKEIEEDKD